MADLEAVLGERLGRAFEAVVGVGADPMVRRSQHADYQADGALAAARRVQANPRELAGRIVGHAELDDLCSAVQISGPGFINLTLRDDALTGLLAEVARSDLLGVPPPARPETVVIDYSGPNVAKEMHAGHLRSTIIGDAAVRLLEWLGHTVIRQNHIGDWGTPFGMLIEHLLDLGEDTAAHELSIGDLNGFYRAARVKFDTDDGFTQRARHRVVLLQNGDPETLRLWQMLITESQRYFMTVYDRLGVRLTPGDFAGESAYHDDLAAVTAELESLGLARESDGALCVFPEGFTGRDGEPLPLIVRKSDGGYGYASTDLAAIRHRLRKLGATRLLYVVGSPQHQHLEMVFQAARQAGWLAAPARAEHVGHGSVLGKDGKMLRSRAGESVRLIDLLDEAVTRAAAAVAEKNPDLDSVPAAAVARAVGIGAVKYADLSTDRAKDYVLDYDRMLSFDGNTGPYLQYAHARIQSIFRRAGLSRPGSAADVMISDPAERALVLTILQFPSVIAEIEQSLQFHRLAGYLFELATAFTGFYERCPVLKAEAQVRDSRLALCALTARILSTGLGLLGIEAPSQL
ncbi:MAG TPA: arginine--tRNA ligase [Pseudonocardiaceae bacterium]|jgi:arginyl-tRNA synthetase|nr:arginine--tRNA ligase [Pseudonocardiaceae bacterium]